jgi:hypothetical protein
VALVRVPFFFINFLPTSLLYMYILLECRFISPEQKAKRQLLASIKMSNAPKVKKVNAACVIFLISCIICLAH